MILNRNDKTMTMPPPPLRTRNVALIAKQRGDLPSVLPLPSNDLFVH